MTAGDALFPLPQGERWWVVQSLEEGRDGLFRIWQLVWGRDEADVARNYEADHQKLQDTLAEHAVKRGEIADSLEWKPLATLVAHERMTPVETVSEIEMLDPLLAAMLREHERFEIEFAEDGLGVIGGSLEWVQ
jgi:hypothetical protein